MASLPSLSALSFVHAEAPTSARGAPETSRARLDDECELPTFDLVALLTSDEGSDLLPMLFEFGFFSVDEQWCTFPGRGLRVRRVRHRAADLEEAREWLLAFRSICKTFRAFADLSSELKLERDDDDDDEPKYRYVETGMWPRIFDAVCMQSGCREDELQELRDAIDASCRTSHPYDIQGPSWHLARNAHPLMYHESTPETHPHWWVWRRTTDGERIRVIPKFFRHTDSSGFWSHAPRVEAFPVAPHNVHVASARLEFERTKREEYEEEVALHDPLPPPSPPFDETALAVAFANVRLQAPRPPSLDRERMLLFLFCVYTQMYIPCKAALFDDDELFGREWEREQDDDDGFRYDVELPDPDSSPYCGRHKPNDAFDGVHFVDELWERAKERNQELIEEERANRQQPEEWLTQSERDRAEPPHPWDVHDY